ncbi:MAG: phosphopantetheine-binding protein, partial [bacterium]|nr:phosphopantetheine-binding protein [bacterium]
MAESWVSRVGLWMLSVVGRIVLGLRYRIRVEGWEELRGLKNAIFLPNHPAEVDPVILEVLLWRRFRPRPAVIEDFYYMPVLHGLLKAMRALPIPNMEQGRSTFKVRRINRALEEVVAGCRRGESFLLYPSGSLQRSGLTYIGGASALHGILEREAGVPLVLVRTWGLWGSSFSWYFRNRRPDLLWCLAHGVGVLLGNLIFFAPRRDVRVEFQRAPEDFPRRGSRAEVNGWLERWYNARGEEPATVVRYSRWSGRVPRATGVAAVEVGDVSEVPEEVRRGVCEEFARMRRCDAGEIRAEMELRRDLGLDSLELAEVLVWLEARFGVTDVSLGELRTVGGVMKIAAGRAEHVAQGSEGRVPRKWFKTEGRPGVEVPRGATLQECFLRVCKRMGNAVAVADEVAG